MGYITGLPGSQRLLTPQRCAPLFHWVRRDSRLTLIGKVWMPCDARRPLCWRQREIARRLTWLLSISSINLRDSGVFRILPLSSYACHDEGVQFPHSLYCECALHKANSVHKWIYSMKMSSTLTRWFPYSSYPSTDWSCPFNFLRWLHRMSKNWVQH